MKIPFFKKRDHSQDYMCELLPKEPVESDYEKLKKRIMKIILLVVFFITVIVCGFPAVFANLKAIIKICTFWAWPLWSHDVDIINIPTWEEFLNAFIFTDIAWQLFLYQALNSLTLILMIVTSIIMAFYALRWLSNKSNKGSSRIYLWFESKEKKWKTFKAARLDKYLNPIKETIYSKKFLGNLILVILLGNGVLMTFIAEFLIWYLGYYFALFGDYLIAGFYWPQIQALWVIIANFVFSLTATKLVEYALIFYVVMSFFFAYSNYNKNTISQEEFLDKSGGVAIPFSGASGSGKTFTMHALASANVRLVKKKLNRWLFDKEQQYSQYIDFQRLRAFYEVNKGDVRNIVDADKLTDHFIKEYSIDASLSPNTYIGQSPTLRYIIQLSFEALYMINDKRRLVNNYPSVIADRKNADNPIYRTWDEIVSMRYDYSPSKVVDLNFMRVQAQGDDDALEKKGLRKVDVEALFVEPGLTIALTEFDKETFHADKTKILAEKTGEFFAQIRHLLSFDNRVLGRLFYDAQVETGVAKVVRGRFDVDYYLQSKFEVKHFILFRPYIAAFDFFYNFLFDEAKDKLKKEPFKKTGFNFISRKVATFINKIYRYLCMFDSVKVKALVRNSSGEKKTETKSSYTFKINVAEAFNTFDSTFLKNSYKERQQRPNVRLLSDLKDWSDFDFAVSSGTAKELQSRYIDETIFPRKKPGHEQATTKTKKVNKLY